jgi:hypothetical protein
MFLNLVDGAGAGVLMTPTSEPSVANNPPISLATSDAYVIYNGPGISASSHYTIPRDGVLVGYTVNIVTPYNSFAGRMLWNCAVIVGVAHPRTLAVVGPPPESGYEYTFTGGFVSPDMAGASIGIYSFHSQETFVASPSPTESGQIQVSLGDIIVVAMSPGAFSAYPSYANAALPDNTEIQVSVHIQYT